MLRTGMSWLRFFFVLRDEGEVFYVNEKAGGEVVNKICFLKEPKSWYSKNIMQ
jgi:hypothetical protein